MPMARAVLGYRDIAFVVCLVLCGVVRVVLDIAFALLRMVFDRDFRHRVQWKWEEQAKTREHAKSLGVPYP
jgi:hypothetical protein